MITLFEMIDYKKEIIDMRPEYIVRLKASEFANRAPFQFITSAELCRALGIHRQTAANWRLRGVGPTAAPDAWFKGRSCRYRLADVWSWAYEQAGKNVPAVQINGEWLRDQMEFPDWQDNDAVYRRTQLMMRVSQEYRPGDLTGAGRSGLSLN